jgi:hypothetical protein
MHVSVEPLSPERLTLLLYGCAGALALLLLLVVVLAVRLRSVRRTYRRLVGGNSSDDLIAAVSHQIEAVDQLRGRVHLIGREAAAIRQRVSTAVRTVGFTRYDAFPEAGGQLSFSAAMLDEAGDGIVLTAINGRSDTRVYAKPVKGGQSTHSLSDEEQAAIGQAIGES